MAPGPGKYDLICTKVREDTKALGVLLIVFAGEHGNGFSAQLPLEELLRVPSILRKVADDIERDATQEMGRA